MYDDTNEDLDRHEAAMEDLWERRCAARQALPYNHPDVVDLPDEEQT